MKTVQYYLKKLKTKKLIEAYLCRYPIQYDEIYEARNLSVNEIRNNYRKNLKILVQRLRKIKIKNRKKISVVYAFKSIDENFNVEIGHIDLNEFLQKGFEAQDYSFAFLSQRELVGFLVAKTEMTKEHIYDLCAEIMYWASFFGIKEEDFKKERKKLDKAIKECESGKSKSCTWEEFAKKFDIKVKEPDEKEKELQQIHIKTGWDLHQYYRNKELAILKEIIKKT